MERTGCSPEVEGDKHVAGEIEAASCVVVDRETETGVESDSEEWVFV